MDDSVGSLEPGKLADVVVVDGDPWSDSTKSLDMLSVDMTIIDGEVVWQRDGL
jgi:imidazolonepropionase-like amidohydrolase